MKNKNGARTEATQVELNQSLLDELHQAPALRDLDAETLRSLVGIELLEMPSGASLADPMQGNYGFCVLLAGELSISKLEEGREVYFATFKAVDSFGEVPLLLGMRSLGTKCTAVADCSLLKIPEESFWKMLAAAPAVRQAVLADCYRRYETHQAMALHREKLISLGTLAAGLMHELNNPGAAARRAAAHLRENLSRLQQISLRMTRNALTSEQLACMVEMQEQVFAPDRSPGLSALEQSDREEELGAWLEQARVENPWRLAPTMVEAGWTQADLECAGASFPSGALSDCLNYLDALISGVRHVNTIEESIARVTDLVTAVKKYAYDDKNKRQAVDVRDSLLSTLTILGHKFRHKQIHVRRDLPPEQTIISCVGAGLAQVWTNLLDNAIDAAPEGGEIAVRLWVENRSVCVSVRDNGPGIPQEHSEHIFEPFYTTKAAGVGTGLGLDIARRIIVGNFHGDIRFESRPGATEFLVRLPMGDPAQTENEGCAVAVQ